MSNRRSKSSRRTDSASIRAAESMLLRLGAGLDVRRAKVRRLRAKLRDHTYVNLLKLDVAARRLLDELTSGQ